MEIVTPVLPLQEKKIKYLALPEEKTINTSSIYHAL